jgi:hypothetical protein
MWEVDEFDRLFKNFERQASTVSYSLCLKTFERHASTVSYSLYRCTMDNDELRWHI